MPGVDNVMRPASAVEIRYYKLHAALHNIISINDERGLVWHELILAKGHLTVDAKRGGEVEPYVNPEVNVHAELPPPGRGP